MGEIEKLFFQDIAQKKQAGVGIYKKTGTRGHVGSVRTPYDFMTNQEKRKLNGKVVISSVYDTIMSLKEFKKLDQEERTKTLKAYLFEKEFSRKQIAETWGISNSTLYHYINKAGLITSIARPEKIESKQAIEEEVERGFNINLTGEFSGKEVQDRIIALGQILSEDKEYAITVQIKEL